MQNQPGEARHPDSSRPGPGTPALGVANDPLAFFADEDDGLAPAPAAVEADRFALFPDERRLADRAAGKAPGEPGSVRPGPEPRTFTITPRVILLAVILFAAAFATVTSCQVAAGAAIARTP